MNHPDLPQDEIELTLLLRNNRLKRLRLAEGLTQKELGVIVDVGNQTVAAAERFGRVGAEKLQRIADYFGVDKEWLFPPWAMGNFAKTRVTKEIPKSGLLQSGREAMTRLMLPDPRDTLEKKELAEGVERVLQTIPFREREIFKMRRGLGGGAGHTYTEVGRKFSISRERVRQIESRVYRKLAEKPRAKILRKLIEVEGEEVG
jgi:RNA polymerase sigma factor (sigma-70 family)